jgi:hypothetical protein
MDGMVNKNGEVQEITLFKKKDQAGSKLSVVCWIIGWKKKRGEKGMKLFRTLEKKKIS